MLMCHLKKWRSGVTTTGGVRGPKITATIAQRNPETMKKTKADKSTAKKDKASSKNSGTQKRPPSAFLVFMEDFRKDFKENFPDNKISLCLLQGGVKWKAMFESTRKKLLMWLRLPRRRQSMALL